MALGNHALDMCSPNGRASLGEPMPQATHLSLSIAPWSPVLELLESFIRHASSMADAIKSSQMCMRLGLYRQTDVLSNEKVVFNVHCLSRCLAMRWRRCR